jgi:hypothetical protein
MMRQIQSEDLSLEVVHPSPGGYKHEFLERRGG